jgi:hypothetical protein
MGTNSDCCSCFKHPDDNGTEADINSENKNKIEILNQPTKNSVRKVESLRSNLEEPEISKIMSNKDYESVFSEKNDLKPLINNSCLPEVLIQSFYRGSIYRKNYKKLNGIKSELIAQHNEKIKSIEKSFITKLILKSEKLFKDSNFENNWRQYYNTNEINLYEPKSNNDILVNTHCLVSKYKNEDCLYKGTLTLDSIQKNKNVQSKMLYNINSLTGRGVLYLRNGKKYEGNFINGELNGWCRYINSKGVCYEGLFIKGVLNGKGEIIKIDENLRKHIYKGDIKNFKKEGKGKEKTNDFSYEGEFVNDMKHGNGKIFYNNNGDYYEGQFSNGLITGKGFYKWKNQHTYFGDFVCGKMHGKGLYKWTDGNQYEGEYINNIKEGQGEFKWNDGKIYKGRFENGKPHGKGLLTIKGITFDAIFDKGTYLGDLKEAMNSPSSN